MKVILSILSNAGGVGKSTLATHLAYEVSKKGYSVALLDLDPQKSLDVFCGLDSATPEESLVEVLSKNFNGVWPLTKVWNSRKIEVCQGHQSMSSMADNLVTRRRGEYVLGDRLRKYPLEHELIIVDCPATLGMLTTNALAASTHILVPLQLEMKSAAGSAGLIEWCIEASDELELEPKPKILGFVPSMYNSQTSIHREILAQLPSIADGLEVNLYPYIRESKEFKNACALGLPLQMYRAKNPASKDFRVIAKDIISLIEDA